jgi:hypothetical protein
LTTRVYKLMNEAGLEIPYAKQDLYIKELPAIVSQMRPKA